MKKSYAYTYSTALLALGFSLLTSNSSIAQSRYQKLYDGGSLESAWAMDADLSGSEYGIVGNRAQVLDLSNIVILKVDSAGTVLSQTEIGYVGGGVERGKDIKVSAGNGWLVAGEASSFGGGPLDATMLKLNSAGTVSWAQTYGSATRGESFNAVRRIGSRGYVATGWAGNQLSQGADTDMYMLFVEETTGTPICGSTFGGNGDDVAYDVAISSQTGTFITIGSTESFGAQGKGIYIVATDSGCTKLWGYLMDAAGDDIPYAIEEEASGYAITGQTNSFSGGSGAYRPFLMRIGPNGQLLSFNLYTNANYDNVGRTLWVNPAGGYVLGGRTVGADSIAWFMGITPNFQVDWFKQYKGNSIEDMVAVAGGVAYMGIGNSTSASGVADMYLISVDVNGNSQTGCNDEILTPTGSVQQLTTTQPADTVLGVLTTTSMVTTNTTITLTPSNACSSVSVPEPSTSQLTLLPNPNNGHFQISLQLPTAAPLRFTLLDLQGRVLMEADYGRRIQLDAEVDASTLPTGMYIARLTAGKQILTQRLIKE